MLRHTTKGLRARSNANAVNGCAPGTLLCSATGAGGGFAGVPESLTVWYRPAGWPEDLFPRAEFPSEGRNYKYTVFREDGSFYVEEHRLKYGGTPDTFNLSDPGTHIVPTPAGEGG